MLFQMLTPRWWFAFVADWWLWYLATVALGWLVFPFLFGWLRTLPDRGYAIARVLGAFLFSYINWVLCHRFHTFSSTSLLVTAIILALLSGYYLIKHGQALARHFRQKWRWILATELFSLFLFMLLVNIRSYCADIQYNPSYHGAEKLANMMILNSLYRTSNFPPEDAWFCQTPLSAKSEEKTKFLNYYYGGHLQWATIARISHVPSSIAFNLALATLFSWIGLAAFSLMLNLTRRITPSLICGFALVFSGNFEPFQQLDKMADQYREWREEHNEEGFSFEKLMMVERFNLWQASRVLLNRPLNGQPASDYTVNEFPYFSFILGDLHAHSSALPLTLAFLHILLAVFYLKQQIGAQWAEAFFREPLLLLLAALLTGGLYFYNSWEIIPLGLLFATFLVWDRADWHSGRIRHLAGTTLTGSVILCAGLFLLFGLFFFNFNTPLAQADASLQTSNLFEKAMASLKTLLIWRPHELGSTAGELFTFWGFIWLPLVALLSGDVLARIRAHRSQRTALQISLAIFGIAILGLLFSFPGAQICAFLLLSSALYAWRGDLQDNESFAARLMLAGFVIVFFAEVIVVNDSMIGNLERYNTVFKLYYPAWAHLLIACIFLVWRQDQRLKEKHRPDQRYALRFAAAILLLLSLTYPCLATWSRTDGFFTAKGNPVNLLFAARPQAVYRERTLDGLNFLKDSTESPDDLAAIRWINANIEGRPHILEAAGRAYSYTGRIAAYTGLLTVVGWDNHELQWRGWHLADVVKARQDDVHKAYQTVELNELLPILARYGIQYVFVGKLERQIYPANGLAKFNQAGNVIYKSGDSIIYDMRPLLKSMYSGLSTTSPTSLPMEIEQ